MKIDSLSLIGKLKTGKTTFALSAPKPMVYFDFELGVQRVEKRFIEGGQDVEVLTYPDIMIADPKRQTKQYIAFWDRLMKDYNKYLEDKNIKTIVFDTFSAVWEIRRLSYLAEIRERDPNRSSLMPQEYFIPNTDMKTILIQSRIHEKILIVVHHTRDEYVDNKPTGREEADGFKYTGDLVDIEFWMNKRDGKPIGRIGNCGLSMMAEGIEIPEPSYDKLAELINGYRSI